MFKPTTIVTTAAVLVSGGALAIAGVSLAGAGEQTQSTAVTAVSRSTPGGGSGYGPGSGCGMGPGGGGMHEYTAVTGDELAKVTDAVKAKDSGVSLTWVGKDQDGDYRGPGTKDGSRVMVEVSKDLATVEVRTGGMGRMGAPGDQGDGPRQGGYGQTAPGSGSSSSSGAASATSTSFDV